MEFRIPRKDPRSMRGEGLVKIQSIHRFRPAYDEDTNPAARILSKWAEKMEQTLVYRQKLTTNIRPTLDGLRRILSLTTYPARVNSVHWTIRTLLNQSVSVDCIVLWLAASQFPGEAIPQALRELENYGVSIRFCEDLRSHKKYFFALREYPDALVITVDDDVIYPENAVETLLQGHAAYPHDVICTQARYITLDEQGMPMPYSQWPKWQVLPAMKSSARLLPIGAGGVLYPPQSLHPNVFDVHTMRDLAFYTDDLWLKCMACLQGTKAVKAGGKSHRMVTLPELKGGPKLSSVNVAAGNNDMSFHALSVRYPEMLDFIKIEGK